MNKILFTGSFSWAFFASVTPGSSHGTTTLGLCHCSRSRFRACSTTESVETEFLADVDAFLTVAAEDVASWTFAPETTFRVDAISLVAQVFIRQTLVNIWKYSNETLEKGALGKMIQSYKCSPAQVLPSGRSSYPVGQEQTKDPIKF